MKTCIKCSETKSLTDFTRRTELKDGFSNYCKNCSRKRYSKYRKINKKELKKRNLKYYYENKDEINEKRKGKYLDYYSGYWNSNKDQIVDKRLTKYCGVYKDAYKEIIKITKLLRSLK